jgi:hypothetical protein
MLNDSVEEIRKQAEASDRTTVYIAVFGQPGAGKSSLVNAIIGRPVAKVGVENDVTGESLHYEWNKLYLTDLPGYGTVKFPKETYAEKFEIAKYDLFMCVTDDKLKEDDVEFFKDLAQMGKRCVFVRNKIDALYEPESTDAQLRDRIVKNFENQIGHSVRVTFTSCKTKEGLADLNNAIEEALFGVKRDRFLRSAAAYSKEFLDKKKEASQKYAWFAASGAALGNMVPIPGAGFAADIAAVISAMNQIKSDFQLTEARLDSYARALPGLAPIIRNIIEYASKQGAILVLRGIGSAAAAAEAAKWIPIIGTVTAGAISLVAVRLVLEKYIDDCYQVAEEALRANLNF